MSISLNMPFAKPDSSGSLLGIGMQSGTSQDGLDVGLFRFKQASLNRPAFLPEMELIEAATVPFTGSLIHSLQECSFRQISDLNLLLALSRDLAEFSAKKLLKLLKIWKLKSSDITFIASHGQTVYHNPEALQHKSVITMQITEADVLAARTGITVVSDFRNRHIAEGGEGAPLAPLYDWAYFRSANVTRVLVNIGGIANITLLKPGASMGGVVYGDTGPGNKIMDQHAIASGLSNAFDDDGKLAASGEINSILLNTLLEIPWLKKPFPKSTGPELFNLDMVKRVMSRRNIQCSSVADLMATLSAFTVRSLSDGIERVLESHSSETLEILVSGGGARNSWLMKQLQNNLKTKYPGTLVSTMGDAGDYKETALFAWLGYSTLYTSGLPIFKKSRLIRPGKISLP